MRAVLFIDYQNSYMLARRYFADSNRVKSSFGQINPTLLANKILKKNPGIREINEIRIYRGIPSASFDAIGHVAAWKPIRGKYSRLSTIDNQPFCYWFNKEDFLEVADHTKY